MEKRGRGGMAAVDEGTKGGKLFICTTNKREMALIGGQERSKRRAAPFLSPNARAKTNFDQKGKSGKFRGKKKDWAKGSQGRCKKGNPLAPKRPPPDHKLPRRGRGGIQEEGRSIGKLGRKCLGYPMGS